jgi:branched-chain amino acid transport system ATP-binding protein
MPNDGDTILEVRNLTAGYGGRSVLRGLSLGVSTGEIVAILGPNGAGKSTLLKAIFGMLRPSTGSVRYRGTDISGRLPFHNLNDGLVYVMQGNRAFDALTVEENLEVVFIPKRAGRVKDRVEAVLELFPKLRPLLSRRAGTLSAGEKQLLALARGLIPEPVLLLLDEPTMGLAPGAVSEALSRLNELNKNLGVTVLLVEQNVKEALRLASRAYVLRLGQVVYEGPSSALASGAVLRQLFLGK